MSEGCVPGPVQIAYAVDDVIAAATTWSNRGVGPFFVREHIDVHNVRVRGRPATFDHSSAYGQWGAVMVELIHEHDAGVDPVVGRTGIHHVAFFVERFGDAAAELRADGCDEVLYAETSTGMPFAFHDARVRSRSPHRDLRAHSSRSTRFYRMVRDASIDWDGNRPGQDALNQLVLPASWICLLDPMLNRFGFIPAVVWPASTTRVCPDTYRESSLARYSAAAAMSSGTPA